MLATILLLAAIFMRASNFCASSNFRACSKFTVCSHFRASSKISAGSYFWPFMLRLHYVPGSHECHDSQKRSSQWGFWSFLSSSSSSVSCYVLSLSEKISVTEARWRAMVCHGWLYVSSQPATFTSSYVPTKFCYVY